jgi:hypothetical protein
MRWIQRCYGFEMEKVEADFDCDLCAGSIAHSGQFFVDQVVKRAFLSQVIAV